MILLAKTNQRRRLAWGILLVFAAGLFWMSRYYAIEITVTDSVPYRIFWLKKGVLPQKYEWVSFIAPENGVYPKDTCFTKRVLGIAGDVVQIQQREFWINDQYVTYAKPVSKSGEPLVLGPAGIIPSKRYFVHAPHQDSFDSRYRNIGWIYESQILGTAVPLF